MSRLAASMLLVLVMSAPLCQAEVSAGSDTVAHARDLRKQAAALSGADAPAADVQRATALLEQAQCAVMEAERATGNPALRQESYNNLLPLAAIYSRQGRKEQALDALDQARMVIWYPGVLQLLRNDRDFDALRKEPRFQAMLAASETPQRLWKGPASDHPYKAALTVEERIAGLTQFWAEARHSFVYFDKVPELDWDQVYMDYLPKVMAAQTTREYYAVLRQLAPLLKDGHTNIWVPGELNDEFNAVPPLRAMLVEGRVLIEFVDDTALRDRVHVGDELLAIDGMPVHEYAKQRVTPLVSAGAPQDRDFQTYTVGLLRGAAKDPVMLHLRAANGKEREVQIARSAGYHWPQAPEFKMLEKGIAYIRIEHFTDDSGLKAFEAALPQILQSRGLVIDMRRNGGGSGDIGYKILGYLMREPVVGATSYVRGADSYLRASSGSLINWQKMPAWQYELAREQVYDGPVVVLTGPQTYSAGEDFVLSFTIMQRGQTIGEATGGSTGQAINFTLPGGGAGRVCSKRDVFPDGREFVGVGVAPSIEVRQTVAGLRAGRDPVLERALAELGKR